MKKWQWLKVQSEYENIVKNKTLEKHLSREIDF